MYVYLYNKILTLDSMNICELFAPASQKELKKIQTASI